MAVTLVPEPDYSGTHGIMQLRVLQREMSAALHAGDWMKLRRLDQSCPLIVEKVIQANRHTSQAGLIIALKELKAVYATVIDSCRQQVAAMAI
jgi:hypothetical protein